MGSLVYFDKILNTAIQYTLVSFQIAGRGYNYAEWQLINI